MIKGKSNHMQKLREEARVKERQKIKEFVSQMFLRPKSRKLLKMQL